MKTNNEKIIAILSNAKKEELDGMGNGWVNMANLGKPLLDAGIIIEDYGFHKLRPFFESMSDKFEVHIGYNKTAKVAYVRAISKEYDETSTGCSNNKSISINNQASEIRKTNIDKTQYLPLKSWAYLYDINKFLQKLAKMSQDEKWSFNNGLPSFPSLPILYNYIRYTFCRLQYQNKIVTSIDGTMAAFNTGLTDNRYEPIIALFKKNRPGENSEWVFFDFVIAGENKGKIINNQFANEIKAATYTDDPTELIYDVNLGTPIVDFDHVVIERIDRLPDSFIKYNAPTSFKVQDTSKMQKNEREEYFSSLREAVLKDYPSYRNMINRVKDSITLALKRVHWNYKNAVPMFYPKENKICLLLPLCLVKDNVEDIALVVKRTPANKYAGVTILPLDWAYSDARVVTRPNSEWLDASLISGKCETII